MPQELVRMIDAYLSGESDGAALLATFRTRVGRVARPYPDVWFVLGRRTEEALDDLTHRVFTACCTVERTGFPYRGRSPFIAFVQDRADDARIGACCFSARWSLTREAMRADYENNLRGDTRARWNAVLYEQVGEVLASRALSAPAEASSWYLPSSPAPVALDLRGALRASGTREVSELVMLALEMGGPTTQSRLVSVIGDVLGGPPPGVEEVKWRAELAEREQPRPDRHPEIREVREVVLAAWEGLDEVERALIRAAVEGRTAVEVMAVHPHLRSASQVTRTRQRCEQKFMESVVARLGGQASDDVLDAILDVLTLTLDLREAS